MLCAGQSIYHPDDKVREISNNTIQYINYYFYLWIYSSIVPLDENILLACCKLIALALVLLMFLFFYPILHPQETFLVYELHP